MAYTSDKYSTLSTAGVQQLQVETGSRFIVLKVVSPFTAQATFAVSDSGRGIWIPYRRWKMWLGVVSGVVLRFEVMKLLGREIVVGNAG